jgi:hypothetical protein
MIGMSKTAVLCFLTLFSTFPALAQDAYYYNDQDKTQIVLDDSLVAEFPSNGALKNAVRSVSPQAEEVVKHSSASVKIWRITNNSARQAIGAATATAPVSPVYRVGGPAGRVAALPGGVIVDFNAAWTSDQVAAWAATNQLTVEKKLDIGGNRYVISSLPGQASLDLANRIHESGDVVSATPNWWMGIQKR